MSITAIDVVRSAVRAAVTDAPHAPSGSARRTRPVVTISRAAGIDPAPIAEALRRVLERTLRPHDPPWLVYDRELVQRVAEDHDLSADLVASLDEHDKSWFEHLTQGLKGIDTGYDVAMKTSRTIRALARVGDAIIVGRGGQCILAKLDQAVHVRLDLPLDWRVAAMARHEGVDDSTARKMVRDRDEDRARYVQTRFQRAIDDVDLYHLAVNVDRVQPVTAAAAIAVVVEEKLAQ